MSSFRRSGLARVFAMALLLWTAVDLANANACSLDNEGLPGTTQASQLISAGSSTTLPTDLAHVDDCFCCSHCVNVQGIVVPNDAVRWSPSYEPPRESALVTYVSS